MFFLFGGYNIRIDHVSAVSAMFDLGPQHAKERYVVQVLLVGGQTVKAVFDDEGLAIKAQGEAKDAVKIS